MADFKDDAKTEDGGPAVTTTLGRLPSRGKGSVEIIASAEQGGLYEGNLAVVDRAIEAIGMGRFQWKLAFSCGFGFLADQILLVSISLVGPQAAYEFGPPHGGSLLSASLYAGTLAGALTVGSLADILGRRNVWIASLFGISAFSMISASAPSWAALNVFVAISAFFGGGNLAIDLTLLSESLPTRWSWILTGLACIWGVGNAISGLIAWPLLSTFGCESGSTPETCSKADNMGWRYFYITVGGFCLLLSVVRALCLGAEESPKWLAHRGRFSDAARVLNNMSDSNGSNVTVSEDDFSVGETFIEPTVWETLAGIRKLYQGARQLRIMLTLTLLWLFVGIAYPLYTIFLPYYLQSHGAKLGDGSVYTTYRNLAISSVVGIFGPALSMGLVAVPWLGSPRTLTITGAICAIFAGLFTQVQNAAQDLAFSSMQNFWLNALYAVIYSYTPLVLPTHNRALGCGVLMAVGRTASLSAPFIATYSDVTSSAPIWVSCAIYIVMGLLGFLLPFEAQSRAR